MIDPAAIPQVPGDMDSLARYAAGLRSAGQNFASTGARVHAAWQGLAGVYVAPEAEQLFAVTVPVTQVADRVGADVEVVAMALMRYADEVRPIQQRLLSLRAQAQQLVSEINGYASGGHTKTSIVDSGSAHAPLAARDVPSTDWRDDAGLVERDQHLNAQVAHAVADWMAAQRRCANAINALYGGTTYVPDDGDAHHARNEFGYSADQLSARATAWGGPEQANPDAFDLFADFGHGALDLLGLLPVVGEPADGLNAAWYGAEGDALNAGLSAAGMIPFAGWAATGAKFGIKGEKTIVKGADDIPVDPHSPLAPQGGLRHHENSGGHTLNPDKAHVGASDQNMIRRLNDNPELRNGVSSYYDRAAAERSVNENIAGNSDRITQWLQSGRSRTEAFDWQHDGSVGRHAPRGAVEASDVTDATGSRVVVQRDPSMPDGYYILTTYPTP